MNLDITQFLQEDNGRYSNTRLNATVLIMSGCGLIIGALYMSKLDATVIAAGGMMITQGLGSKLIQKPMEEKNAQINSSTNP